MTDQAIEEAVRLTIEGNPDMVEKWLADAPKSWGHLAGKAVAACRRKLGRGLVESERRLVWSTLWQRLTELKAART